MSRRLRLLRIAPTILPSLFREDAAFQVCENGLPADAQVVGVVLDITVEPHGFLVTLISESWSEIAEGAETPFLDPVGFSVQVLNTDGEVLDP